MRYLAVALVLAIAPSAFAELVSNGGFESPSISTSYTTYDTSNNQLANWTLDSGEIDLIGSYWQANGGSQSLDLTGSGIGAGSISQTLATTSGQQYTLTYYMAGNPDGLPNNKSLTVTAVGSGEDLNQTTTFTLDGSQSTTSMGWTLYQFNFVASSTSEVLTFTSNNVSPYGPAIDDVSVVESPEPGALALFALGLGGIGLWRRSQKKRPRAS